VFNVGPLELLVLALVGLIVIGPDKLPGLARDAARLLRTLRDMATGARSQLRDELGPEFADVDLRSLNPRTAIQRAVFGDDDLSDLNPRTALQRALSDEPDAPTSSAPRIAPAPPPPPAGRQPLGRSERAPFDEDAT
jgi:sec-independent protein translocase protein TatB